MLRRAGDAWRETVVADPLGRPVTARWLACADGTAVVDCAEAVGLSRLGPAERDPLIAVSDGLGTLLVHILESAPARVVVGVGGTATVDGGAGMRAVLGAWPAGVRLEVACDVDNPLLGPRGAARAFGPQKGADAAAVETLERRLAGLDELAPYRNVRGAGAGGGLGAAFAAIGGRLVRGAELVLDRIRFDERAAGAALVITGEGRVDETTFEGKAPGVVRRRCAALGVRCELFGGVVVNGFAARRLSGLPERAALDLDALGEQLGSEVLRR